MSSLEDKLLQLLTQTQSTQAAPRKNAEAQLQALGADASYPLVLLSIAAHSDVDTAQRQAALTTLRQFVERNWGGGYDEDGQAPEFTIGDKVRESLRVGLLELATSEHEERKVRTGARYEVQSSLRFECTGH